MFTSLTQTIQEVMEGNAHLPQPEVTLHVEQLGEAQTTEVVSYLSERPLHTVVMRGMIRDNGLESELNRGTFYGARAALPLFRAQGRGHLIIVSSIVGRRGIGLMSGYSATKAAQVAFAESLRTEFSGTAIAVSVVLPVSTETEFRSAMQRAPVPRVTCRSRSSSRSSTLARRKARSTHASAA